MSYRQHEKRNRQHGMSHRQHEKRNCQLDMSYRQLEKRNRQHGKSYRQLEMSYCQHQKIYCQHLKQTQYVYYSIRGGVIFIKSVRCCIPCVSGILLGYAKCKAIGLINARNKTGKIHLTQTLRTKGFQDSPWLKAKAMNKATVFHGRVL